MVDAWLARSEKYLQIRSHDLDANRRLIPVASMLVRFSIGMAKHWRRRAW